MKARKQRARKMPLLRSQTLKSKMAQPVLRLASRRCPMGKLLGHNSLDTKQFEKKQLKKGEVNKQTEYSE
jgi:hypothetical protein